MTAPRTVLLASPRSFCAGVERAIKVVERALEGRRTRSLLPGLIRTWHKGGHWGRQFGWLWAAFAVSTVAAARSAPHPKKSS